MSAIEARSVTPRYKVYFHSGDEIYSGDLVFVDRRALLVVSWTTSEGRRIPDVTIPLDLDLLKAINTLGTLWRYSGELVDAAAISRACQDGRSTVLPQSQRIG